jgi:ABC-type phosphate transport system substrate-binding protein
VEIRSELDAFTADLGADPSGLGFFGYGIDFVDEQLATVAVDAGQGCVAPSERSVRSARYDTLAMPLFLYVQRASLGRLAVQRFVRGMLVPPEGNPGLVTLSSGALQAELARLRAAEKAAG